MTAILDEVNQLKSDFRSKISRVRGVVSSYEKSVESIQDDIDAYKLDVKITTTLLTIMDKFIDISNEDTLNEIKTLINQGLRVAFPNSEHHIEAEYKFLRGAQVIEFTFLKNGKVESLDDAQSGGMLDLVSFIFRVLMIELKGTPKVLFLDEALNGISDDGDYSEKASALIRNVCEKRGFTVLLVSHKDGLSSRAHKSYRGVKEPSDGTYESVDTLRLNIEE